MTYDGVPGVVETREAFGETTLVVDPARLVEACTHLRDEEGFNFLSDIAATDYLGWGEQGVAGYIGTAAGRDLNEPGSQGLAHVPDAEAEAVLGLVPPAPRRRRPGRVRVQVWLDDGEAVATLVPVWPAADWFEREAWDMLGIALRRPPEPRRASSCPRTGRDIRCARTTRSAASRCASRTRTEWRSSRRTRIYEGSRIPQPVPDDPPRSTPTKHDLDDILRVNFGPNHPSTHGVLRLVVDLDGETVAGIEAVIGYLHTGFEKTMEAEVVVEVRHVPRADRLPLVPGERARVRARDREAARDRGARGARPGRGWRSPS